MRVRRVWPAVQQAWDFCEWQIWPVVFNDMIAILMLPMLRAQEMALRPL